MSATALPLILVGGFAILLLAVIKKLLIDEVSGWVTPLSERLIRIAAGRLPRNTHRYEEEWLAELATLGDRRLSGLRFALSVLHGSRSMESALEDSDTEPESSLEEIASSTEALAPDLDRVAAFVRKLVEKTRHPDSVWSQLVNELGSILSTDNVEDELDRIDETFADCLEDAKECEPYHEWLNRREIQRRRAGRLKPSDPWPTKPPASVLKRKRPQIPSNASGGRKRWSGLSGPDWWRRG